MGMDKPDAQTITDQLEQMANVRMEALCQAWENGELKICKDLIHDFERVFRSARMLMKEQLYNSL